MPTRFHTIHHPELGLAKVVASSVHVWLARGWSLVELIPAAVAEQSLPSKEGDSTGTPESSQEGTPLKET